MAVADMNGDGAGDLITVSQDLSLQAEVLLT